VLRGGVGSCHIGSTKDVAISIQRGSRTGVTGTLLNQ
jgi:hypothetical protein